VLSVRRVDALAPARVERGDQRGPGARRGDDVVDVAALGGRERVGELLAVLLDQLGPAGIGVVRRIELLGKEGG